MWRDSYKKYSIVSVEIPEEALAGMGGAAELKTNHEQMGKGIAQGRKVGYTECITYLNS